MQIIRNQKDFGAGLMFTAIGLGYGVAAIGYGIGSPERPGPGFFPALLALASTGLGLAVLSKSLMGPRARLEAFNPRVLGIVVASVVAFGLIIPLFGMIPAIVIAVVISSFGTRQFNWQRRLATAAVLAVLCVALFVYVLGLPVKPLNWELM
ncbi:tripartite tricarboxylate transporter TctB family protein [Corticibacterium sp. UT-5YL-CI-8]|nr:tripartite tricarboxylate transporter TctB family protein [Tianweitania sp. UT-5YL-CI-8]